MMSATAVTYRYEKWRALSGGILETAGATFLLLIAVRAFNAGPTDKALIAGGSALGLLSTPWVVSRVAGGGIPVARAAAMIAAVGACAFFVGALVHSLPIYIACCVVGMAATSAMVPLLTHIYQESYPEAQRGRLFGNTIRIRVAMAMVFSYFGGRFLSGHMERFPAMLVIFGLAFVFSGFCFSKYPSGTIEPGEGTHPFRALRFVKEDKLFRWTLISWMLMGSANLMMLPLRVEYLANPRFGMHLDAVWIAVLTGVIPNLARFLMSPLWGWAFDNLNFFLLRLILNLGFVFGILAFFTGQSFTGLILGAVLFGVANAGGDVAWSLWVTKFAPAGRVADYMSVHTFLTGVRGVIAPLVAFHLVASMSIGVFGALCAATIVAASLMLIPEIRGQKGKPAAPLVEAVE